jgi:hypothetical protein
MLFLLVSALQLAFSHWWQANSRLLEKAVQAPTRNTFSGKGYTTDYI